MKLFIVRIILSIPCLLFLFNTLESPAQRTIKDEYGGDKRIKGKVTGFFHLEKIGNRHMLITPEGNGFFALGVNHISTVEKVKPFSVTDTRLETENILKDLVRWNVNNCGYGCPDYLQERMPFMASMPFISNGHYLSKQDFGFEDVFEDDFVLECEEKIKALALKHRKNPFLIGYYWTDTPRWDLRISRKRHGKDWVSHLKNLPASAMGKQRFVEFIRSRYPSISDFNRAYNVHFTSFDGLLDARFDHLDPENPNIQKDNDAFLALIAEHLYGTLYGLMKRYDPDHLIFGDKYLLNDHPEGVLKAAAKYVDAIAIQPGPAKGPGPGQGDDELYFNKDLFDKIHQLTQKPIIICDHQTSFFTEQYPVTLWHQMPNQLESVDVHFRFLSKCAESDYIIGYQRCQYIDFYDASRGLLKQGILRENGKPYKRLAEGLARNNKKIIELVFSDRD